MDEEFGMNEERNPLTQPASTAARGHLSNTADRPYSVKARMHARRTHPMTKPSLDVQETFLMSTPSLIQPRTLKGFRDYLPETMIPRERLIDTAKRRTASVPSIRRRWSTWKC